MNQLINTEIRSAVAWLTLNSPENMNAFSLPLLEELDGVLDWLIADGSARCVVITGSGQAFSAGGDLAGFKADLNAWDKGPFINRLAYAQTVFNKVEALSMPVIAAVNGYAIAGGLELLLCCDIVLAAESARIGDGHAQYGIIPAGGATARLARKISPNRANLMFFTADLFPAQTLADWGLVNEVVPDEELMASTSRFAEKIARHSPLGLSWVKRLLREGEGQPAAQLARAEIDAFRAYASSDDLAEGLAAFAEKRRPNFTGQ